MQSDAPVKGKVPGELMILFECLLWGIGNPISKIGMEQMPPLWCIGLRFSLAFLLFMLIFTKRITANFPLKCLGPCLVISVFNGLAFIFGNLSLCFTTATVSSFLMSLSVIFTPFVSMLLLKRRYGFKTFFCILIVIAGLYFLCGGGEGFRFGAGELLALLCSASLGVCLTLTSKYIYDIDPVTLAASQSAVAAILAVSGALIFEGPLQASALNGTAVFAVVYMAAACTVAAYILQNIAIRRISAVFASVVFCMEPVFTSAAAYVMLDERLSAPAAAGAVLIIAGVAAASLFQAEESGTGPELTPGKGDDR